MKASADRRVRHPRAIVFSGGAARGAWEAGVLVYVLRNIASQTGQLTPFDVISGTSVGAFHAAILATFAGDPSGAAAMIERAWSDMSLDDLLRLDTHGVRDLIRGLAGRARVRERRAALLEMRPFEKLLTAGARFGAITEHLRAGGLRAVTVSATHVATGRTTVFVATGDGSAPESRDPTTVFVPVQLTASHVLASAAIPLLFPAVSIDDELFCDGGIRQLVPLRPALRLGAESLLVLSSRAASKPVPETTAAARERAYASPIYLAGKLLDAVLLDHVDGDLERVEQINQILAAGRRRYGPRFEDQLASAMGPGAHDVRTVDVVVLRPSEDLGRRAAEMVRSAGFVTRAPCATGRLLRTLADAEGSVETDLVSYLLFDGEYTSALFELGMADARARHDELCAFLAAECPIDAREELS